MSVQTASTAARCRASKGSFSSVRKLSLAPVLLQADHLAADHIREDGPEALSFATLDFVRRRDGAGGI
jgi:hypothetical protein